MKRGTGFAILGAIIFLLAWDLFRVMQDGGYDNTISQWVYQTSLSWPILPFLVGVVCGHLFFPIRSMTGGEKAK